MPTPDVVPLTWPQFWLKQTAFQRFVVGLPVIGLQDRTHKFIAAQLESRIAVDTNARWSDGTLNVAVVDAALAEIEAALRWPNHRFIPDDPMDVVFFDPPNLVIDDLTVDAVLTRIEELFSARPMPDFWSARWHVTLGRALHDLWLLRGT